MFYFLNVQPLQPSSQMEAVFTSMSRLIVGIDLYSAVNVDVAAAIEALRGITERVRGERTLCYGDSNDKYRQGMGQWAGVLGWKYEDYSYGTSRNRREGEARPLTRQQARRGRQAMFQMIQAVPSQAAPPLHKALPPHVIICVLS